MGFQVAARTILELGAELISSDSIALYELIKNSYDAGSKRATIDITTVFRFSELRNAIQRINRARARVASGEDELNELQVLQAEIVAKIDRTAPEEAVAEFSSTIGAALDLEDLERQLATAFDTLNFIEVKDTGDGMSLADLSVVFMTIGTTSRLTDNSGRQYVGGKGIGRLSAMRLGDRLDVKTSTMGETHWNRLDIDWRLFSHSSSELLSKVVIEPYVAEVKSDHSIKGTELKISALKADWDRDRVGRLATRFFDRLFDPFGTRPRYPLVVKVNGLEVNIPAFDNDVLAEAQAKATITYTVNDGNPRLVLAMDYIARGRTKVEVWDRDDILGITSREDISVAAIESLGGFTAHLHWFNRQKLKAIEGYGDREKVKDTINHWANGLLMYRDGFRVNPYGNPDDDWMGVDARALSAGGYKVNRKQLVGAVYITARGNPHLIDQTNREGLRSNEEKTLLVLLLQKAVTDNFKRFLNEVEKEYRRSSRMTVAETEQYLDRVDAKMKETIRTLSRVLPDDQNEELVFLSTTFEELQDRLSDAKVALSNAERDQRDLVDLAGVGLQVEIVAHELARVTRRTLDLINELRAEPLPARAVSTFGAVESQMLVIRKRLDVLDPLGPSSRNRKAKLNLIEVVDQVVASHEDQFDRFGIVCKIQTFPSGATSFEMRAVKGMIVQVLENLIDNSVFWLRQKMRAEPSFRPRIDISINVHDGEIQVTDNGPGVAPARAEEIFRPFVTFKPPGEGKGLGLFISREIARRHSGELYLRDETSADGKLRTFVLDVDGN